MSLLVVGTVAFDSVSTKSGSRENAPGGSAFYFSISSSFFSSTSIVGVVGTDYSEKYFSMLESSGINIDGLEKLMAKHLDGRGNTKTMILIKEKH